MTEEYTAVNLSKKKKAELVEICRSKKIPVTGTKDVLVGRILNVPGAPFSLKGKGNSKARPADRKECAALALARKNMPAHVLVKNSFGKFEHHETGFVFDQETKKVIGRQDEDETVHLSMTDLDVCKQFGFQVDESRVIKGFSEEKNSGRLVDLEKYMDDQDVDGNTDEE